MDKAKVEAFMVEYEALCRKYHIYIGGFDDGPFLNGGEFDESFEVALIENLEKLRRDA